MGNYRLSYLKGNTVMVAHQPLIFFHVHSLKKIREWLYNPSWDAYGVAPSMVLRRKIYASYIRVLLDMHRLVPVSVSHPIANGVRYQAHVEYVARASWVRRLVRRFRTMATLGPGLLRGRYIFVMHGHVI